MADKSRKATVMVVDDNPLVLKVTRSILEKEGFRVLTALGWPEVKEHLAAGVPDIIFLDVNLPRIAGDEISRTLRENPATSQLPIVLISELPEEAVERLFPTSGADSYIRKPLTREILLEAIRRHIPVHR